MPNRESFLLRLDPKVLDAIRRWADDDLRSVNGQLDFLLRKALKDAGRLKKEEQRKSQSGSQPDKSKKAK